MVQKYPTVRRKRKPSDICKEIKLQQGVLVSVLSLLFHLSSKRPIQPFIPSGIWPQYCMRMRGHVHLTAGPALGGGKASYSFQRHFPLLCLFTGSSSTSPLPGGSPQFICSCWQQYISEVRKHGSTQADLMMV